MLALTVALDVGLRDQAFETGVFSADLLGRRVGAGLQVGVDITHERPLLGSCTPILLRWRRRRVALIGIRDFRFHLQCPTMSL
jgi:hypothetical protein